MSNTSRNFVNNPDQYIYVISDPHMGDGGWRDDFAVGDREQKFLAFLDMVEKHHAKLIINGDLFEFWQLSISKVLSTRKNIIDKLSSMDVEYIIGNHEYDFKYFIGTDFLKHPLLSKLQGPMEKVIGGKRFKFLHGHEYDSFNNTDNPTWGHILSIFAGIYKDQLKSQLTKKGKYMEEMLERYGSKAFTYLNRFIWIFQGLLGVQADTTNPWNQMSPSVNPGRLREHLLQIQGDREKEGYDYAIVGHTHIPGKFKDWYFNSGSWKTEHNNFLIISPSGKVKIYEWTDNGPKEVNIILNNFSLRGKFGKLGKITKGKKP